MMTKLQFYKYGMWLLLLINVGLIAFILFSPKPPKSAGSHQFMKEVVQLLQLDTAQEETFGRLAQGHKEKMNSLDKQIKKEVAPYFLSVTKGGLTDQDSIQDIMAGLERQKIIETYKHFEDVNEILKPEQKKHFERFVSQALNIIMRETGPEIPRD